MGPMRRVALLIVAVSLYALPAQARSKFSGFIQQGGAVVVAPRVGSTAVVQRTCAGGTVDVYLAGTTTLATLYRDAAGTSKPNHITVPSSGLVEFYTDAPTIKYTVTGGGCTAYTIDDYKLSGASTSEISVADFGCAADGVTDDTSCFQDAIDSLPDYTVTHPNYAHANTTGGGIVFVPAGKYRVAGTLFYKSSLEIRGVGWSSQIWHDPPTPGTNLWEGDPSAYAGLNGHHDFRVSNMSFSGSANSGDCFHLDRTRNFVPKGLLIQYFRGSGVYIKWTNGTYSFYQTFENCIIVNNGTGSSSANLYIDSTANAGTVVGGQIGGTVSAATAQGMTMSDYFVVVKGAGWVFIGTSIEGEAGVAQVHDYSCTSFIGYTETGASPQKPYVHRELPATSESAVACSAVLGMYHASSAALVKYSNFDQTTLDTSTFSHSGSYSYAIGNPVPIKVFSDGSFYHGFSTGSAGVSNWQVSASHSTVVIDTKTTFASRASLAITHSGDGVAHTQFVNIGDNLKPYLYKRVFVTAMIYDAAGTFPTTNFKIVQAGANRFSWKCADFGNNWYQFCIDIPVTSAGVASNGATFLSFTQPASAAGTTLYLTNVQAWLGGYPIGTAERRDDYNGGPDITALSAAPSTGVWHQGNVIFDTDAAAGAAPGWYVVTAGEFSSANTTCDTSNGSAVLTNCASTTAFGIGYYATSTAGFTGVRRIIDKTSTTITLDTTASSSNVGATIDAPDPVVKTQATIAP